MAAVEIVTTDSFYKDLPSFIRLCNILYNGLFDPEVFDPADAMEIAWGITETLIIWPPGRNEEKPFADQIVQYIGMALKEEGILVPPDVLRLGVADNSEWEKVQMQYSDDPQMFASIYAIEKDKTNEINAEVKTRLSMLITELEKLPLDNGNAGKAVSTMFSALKKQEEQGSKLQPI